jgi:hypothetical protein
MSIVPLMNDIEHIYTDAKPIFKKGGYNCPVCKKEYKQEKRCQSHIDEQDCYNVKTLFQGTHREEMARKLFMAIMADSGSQARTSLMAFRKHKTYGAMIKFSVFCSVHEVKSPELYYAWVRDVKGFKMVNAILKQGRGEGTVHSFRTWLHQNPHYIDNDVFMDRNENCLQEDTKFFILSVEKAHISPAYYMQFHGIDQYTVIASLPLDYQIRFQEIMKLY